MKKRILSAFLFVVLTVTGAAALTGCGGDTYKITYNIEHATDSPTPTTYKLSRNDVDLWVPEVEDGYVFENWYSNEDFNGVALDYIPAGTKKDMEFFGRVYKQAGYDVSYTIMCEGEELDITPPSTKTNYKFNKREQFTPWEIEESIMRGEDEYQFEGWYSDAQMEGDTVSAILRTDLGDKTLYGEYVKGAARIPYNLTFIVDGVEVELSQKTYKKSRSNQTLMRFTEYDSNEAGFDGWYENPDFTGNKVNSIPANTEGDKTYYGRMREPEGYGDKTNRKKATDFTLHSGRTAEDAELGLYKELKLSDFYGAPVLLNFWSSNCGPCGREMPYMQYAYDKYSDQVEFLFINAMALDDTPTAARDFLKDNGYTIPWHHDNGAGAKAKATTLYKISYFPTTVLIDKWGYIAKFEAKELKSNAEVDGLIDMILDK